MAVPLCIKMKKSQIKMFETVGILVVFFFLLSIAASVYFTVQRHAAAKEAVRQTEVRALQVITKTFYLPELECSFLGVRKEACYDKAKLSAFEDYSMKEEVRPFYFQLFGFSEVVVEEVFPSNQSWILWNYTPEKWSLAPASFSPVILQDASTGRYSLGLVKLKIYSE